MDALAPTGVPVPAIVATDESEPAWFAMQLVARRVPGAGARRPRGGAGAGRGPDAAGRRDAAGPARRTPRQGPGRRAAAVSAATSSTAGPARWRRCPPDLVPDAERLHQRLADSVPAAVAPTLVHGDYRLGNLICRRHRAGRAHRLGDLERRRPAGRAGLVPGLRRRRQLPGRRPRGRPGCPTADELVGGVRRGRPAASTTSRGSTPWAATRWPRSWATTCAGTSRAATTTPTRNASRTPSAGSSRPGCPPLPEHRFDTRGTPWTSSHPPERATCGLACRCSWTSTSTRPRRSTTPRSPRPPTRTSSRR